MNLTIITAVLAFVIGLFGGYQWQAQNITQLKLEYEQQQSSNARDALKSIEHHSAQISNAQSVAVVRRSVIVADRGRSDNAAAGLRSTASSTVQASSVALATCNTTADTLTTVFGACVQELISVAESADGHASDALMLKEAWPK